MGDLDVSSFQPIVVALPLAAAAFGLFATLPRAFEPAQPRARQRGGARHRRRRARSVSPFSARRWPPARPSRSAAPSASSGIIVPHLVRLLVGSDHRLVLPASAIFGAAFLVACDTLARTVIAPVELPVGVITALLGGPFFLWLLVRR